MSDTWWTDPKKLDAAQRKVVALDVSGNYLVVGPAGCGKTNLLLLRAKFLHRSGKKNIAIFTFGRVLREFLVTGAENYNFSPDKIQTYVQWGASLLKSNGVDFDSTGKFEDVRARLLNSLTQLAEEDLAENKVDCVLLDEAQDYSAEEIDVIARFADQVFAVGDQRQKISGLEGALHRLEELCDSKIELTDHYRNGMKICRVADGIRNSIDSEFGLEATSKYDESKFESSVDDFTGLSLQEQIDTAADAIAIQIDAYPGDMIGVLCPKQEDVQAVYDGLIKTDVADHVQLQHFAGGYSAFRSDKRVIVTTIHGAKGLEFRALHLLATDHIRRFPTQRNMSYTAVTRCKTSLKIYHHKSLPGYLEKGLSAADPDIPEPPTLDDLFD